MALSTHVTLCGRLKNIVSDMAGHPSYRWHLDHPFGPAFYDARSSIRGWIAARSAIETVILRCGDRIDTAVRFVERKDVVNIFGSRYSCITGFQSSIPVGDWLGGAEAVTVTLYITFKNGEQKLESVALESTSALKRQKRARFMDLLICPGCRGSLQKRDTALECSACRLEYPVTKNAVDFLTPEVRGQFDITETENVSAWEYDPRVIELLEKNPDKLFLDCGAGLRKEHYPQVINYEIVDYSSTDILGVGERLPFRDQSLDGVISVGVLEHVKDPFLCAREIMRVLKSGGTLFCAVPFLQPLHAYPHHYYNMTLQGLVNLFNGMKIEEQCVPMTLHPIHAIKWILFQYALGLSEPERAQFENMRVKDFFPLPGKIPEHPVIPFVHHLDREKWSTIASGHCIVARKP